MSKKLTRRAAQREAEINSAGDARDHLDVGLDLIRTCQSACYQNGGCSKDDIESIASTLEQAMKRFVQPAREWLDELNYIDVERSISNGGAK